jgi:hypothetical protein
MATQDKILSNWIFKELEQIGTAPAEHVYVWSQGLALHNQNLRDGLQAQGVSGETQRKILTDLWKVFHDAGLDQPNAVLGVSAEPQVDKINDLLGGVLSDQVHPAILAMGADVNEALYNWVRAFALYDYANFTSLERHIGAKDGLAIFMAMWEAFALGALDHVKQAVGIDGPEDVTMAKLGQLSKSYWESIGISYHPTVDTEDVHEAELGDCAYWCNMREILGEETARTMTLQTEAHVSINYYDAVLKALGVFDRYRFRMTSFACCGDDKCVVRFERRE